MISLSEIVLHDQYAIGEWWCSIFSHITDPDTLRWHCRSFLNGQRYGQSSTMSEAHLAIQQTIQQAIRSA